MINSNTKMNIHMLAQLIFFFFIDICVFSLYSRPLCYLLLYRYVLHILTPESALKVSGTLFLLLLESIVFNGRLMPAFFCFIPVTIAFFQIRQMCYLNRILFILLSVLLLLIQVLFIEGLIFDNTYGNNYTFFKIVVNLILIVFFSLKLHFQSSQDNRCLG